jgi:hypothetical protein
MHAVSEMIQISGVTTAKEMREQLTMVKEAGRSGSWDEDQGVGLQQHDH